MCILGRLSRQNQNADRIGYLLLYLCNSGVINLDEEIFAILSSLLEIVTRSSIVIA